MFVNKILRRNKKISYRFAAMKKQKNRPASTQNFNCNCSAISSLKLQAIGTILMNWQKIIRNIWRKNHCPENMSSGIVNQIIGKMLGDSKKTARTTKAFKPTVELKGKKIFSIFLVILSIRLTEKIKNNAFSSFKNNASSQQRNSKPVYHQKTMFRSELKIAIGNTK